MGYKGGMRSTARLLLILVLFAGSASAPAHELTDALDHIAGFECGYCMLSGEPATPPTNAGTGTVPVPAVASPGVHTVALAAPRYSLQARAPPVVPS